MGVVVSRDIPYYTTTSVYFPKTQKPCTKFIWICISANEECFGGVARLKKVVDDLKDEHGNVIFVNGGDFYQGTIWYTKFKWKVVSKFANLLNFTAMVWTSLYNVDYGNVDSQVPKGGIQS